MIEAAPTVTAKSAAICGSSESVERTIAWLAKPATARSAMARVGVGVGRDGEGASTGRSGSGRQRRQGFRDYSEARSALPRPAVAGGMPGTHGPDGTLTEAGTAGFLARHDRKNLHAGRDRDADCRRLGRGA